jgi:signal transduction histidine kinase
LPDSNGDPNAIRQVWINLISNAIKYSRNNKEPNIEIGSFNDLSLPNQQIFFIKDNGVGFDEKYKNKLFKVFQRLHAADQFEGTGVGLAIVEKVISKHGGKVWTEAEVNKGACFYFSLPLKS